MELRCTFSLQRGGREGRKEGRKEGRNLERRKFRECRPTESCLNRGEEWNNGLVKFDCVVRWNGTINMEMNDILIDRNSSLFYRKREREGERELLLSATCTHTYTQCI